MEPRRTLRTLWLRRRLVAAGALIAALAALLSVYRVELFPPSLESRTNVFATASTELLVDTPGSAFADLARDLEPLQVRAAVFARFLATPAAVALIAREAELPRNAVEAQGPYEQTLPLFQQEPTAEQRSSQIIGERALYRLRFESAPSLPIVSVFAQAPSRERAEALAAAVPMALRAYIDRLQTRQRTPAGQRVQIRQLGRANGGVVNEGADLQIAALVFLVVFGVCCMLVLPGRTIAQGWRERDSGGWERRGGNGNGHGDPLPPRPARARDR